jgi:hypothetical protein
MLLNSLISTFYNWYKIKTFRIGNGVDFSHIFLQERKTL